MSDEISRLRAVLNETNIQILALLRTNSLNPREIARLLQKDESQISRSLRTLERFGLVEGRWMRIGGKNIKVYSLKFEELRISFDAKGLRIAIGRNVLSYTPTFFESRAPEVKTFVGRKKEIEMLSGPQPVVVVYGIAGIGKSTLVARVFKDAFWYSITEEDTIEYVTWQLALYLSFLGFSEMLEYLRGGGKDIAVINRLALKGINETNAIAVFDDIHKCQDEDIETFIRFLSSHIEKGKLILISREKPRISYDDRVLVIHLKGLDSREAYELLKLKIPEITPEEFSYLYQMTFGHPLMLILVSENPRFSGENLFEYFFREVYETLSEDEKLILQVLSLFDEPVDLNVLKKLFAHNPFPVLYSLMKKGLVERFGSGYSLHDLLRGFVEEVRTISEREYYREYIEYLLEKNTAKSFLTAFKYAVRLEDENLIKDMTELRIRKLWRVALDFPASYMKLLDRIKHSPYSKKEIARIYFNRGFFEKALKLWLEVKDIIRDDFHRFDVLMMLVDVYCELGNTDKAVECFAHLERIFSWHPDDPYMKLGYYIELTKIHTFRRERREALESAFKELEALRAYPHIYPELEALVLYHIGYLYVEMGNLKKGLKYYREGLKVSKAYSLPFMENLGYIQLGIANYSLKNYKAAADYSRKAAEYFLKVKNYRRAIDALFRMTVSLIGLGEFAEAENAAHDMIKLAQSTNYPLGWSAYILLGILRELQGKEGRRYLEIGLKKVEGNEYISAGLKEELSVIFDEKTIQKWLP